MTEIKLLPLTPEYDDESHKVYLKAVENALAQSKAIKNIALTGGYGVGKSSILEKVAEVHLDKVVRISLSTLGVAGGDGGGDKVETSPTNRIQKEIVKQLLYREEPYKMPGSRFRRIARLKFWRSFGAATLGGFVFTLTFFLTGWTSKLATLFHTEGWGLWFQLVTLAVLTMASHFSIALLHNRVTIKGLKVASTEITLASGDTTYFDQFIDEIVYFFDVTKYDIVIFEDIDRFDDPHIFETLRALNTLLNGSKQLDGRSIRFIYAIKDSIFEQLGQRAAYERVAETTPELTVQDRVVDEVARASRTKFFDVVIPVVPFITHRNARDLVSEVMKEVKPSISADLIDLAARHLPDMRLIKNVHNEFSIFKAKVFGAGVELSEEELFAMMLYKNTHLTDFELIRSGRSKLDSLYASSRQVVRASLDNCVSNAFELNRRLAKLNSAEIRSGILGRRLLAYIDGIRIYLNMLPQDWQITFQGERYARADLELSPFWQAVAAAPAEEVLTIIAFTNAARQPHHLVIPKSALATELDDSLSQSEWDATQKETLQQELAVNQKDQVKLRHASFQELYVNTEFTNFEGQSFHDLVEITLQSELARQLVATGFISENFVLYTSTYYGNRVSANALNFLIHNVDRDVMDVDYQIEGVEVEALIKERGDSILQERGFYNVSILDYLLESGGTRATTFVKSLQTMGEVERQFLTAYIAASEQVEKLVAMMAASWSRTLMFVLGRDDLEEERKVSLFDVALLNVGTIDDFRPDDSFRSFVDQHASELGSLHAEATTVKQAQMIASIFSRASIRLASISDLSKAVREAVVAANCFQITLANLTSAVGCLDISLDQIKRDHPPVYNYINANLPEYLDTVEGQSPVARTIAASDGIPAVIKDVVARDIGLVGRVLDRADLPAEGLDLISVPVEAWPAVADHNAFPPTFANVRAYIDKIGGIDESLGGYLNNVGAISVMDDDSEDERETLAKEILFAVPVIPEAATRVGLVKSLELKNYLAQSDIPTVDGALIGLLIGNEVIEDNSESYRLAVPHDWSTKETAILASKEFMNYMTPAELPVADIPDFLRSNTLTFGIKDAVVARLDEFVPDNDPAALRAIAEYASSTKTRLTWQQLVRVANAAVDPDVSTNLLGVAAPGLNLEELKPVLEAIGGSLTELLTRDGRRPKIDNNEANKSIAQRLKELDQISSFKEKGDKIEVALKQS